MSRGWSGQGCVQRGVGCLVRGEVSGGEGGWSGQGCGVSGDRRSGWGGLGSGCSGQRGGGGLDNTTP